MTIDVAIAREKEMAKQQNTKYDKCPTRMKYCCEMCFHNPKCNEVEEHHEQIAELLEELKMLRELKAEHRKIGNIEGFNKGYNKAIDDCLKIVEWDGYTLDIKRRIEQLKAGGENES